MEVDSKLCRIFYIEKICYSITFQASDPSFMRHVCSSTALHKHSVTTGDAYRTFGQNCDVPRFHAIGTFSRGVIKILTVDRYISDIRVNLAVESPQLIRRLRELSSLTFNPRVELLDFELFVEPTRHEISIRMFSMDRFANEVFGARENGFSGSTEVVDDIRYYSLVHGVNDNDLDEDEYMRLDNEFYEFYQANEDNGLEQAELNVWVDWFLDCWNAIEGINVGLPCYIGLHDYGTSFDFKHYKWVTDEEKFNGESL